MVRVLHTADWHLGHRKVPSELIVARLRKYLLPKLDSIDVMFIVGDIFDGVINLNDPDSAVIVEWFIDLLHACSTHGVVLRIVRGTFSHDRNQLRIIESIQSKLKFDIDMRVIDTVTIETHDNFSAVYVPDSLPFKSSYEVVKHVENSLANVGVDKVDFICVHGEFRHLCKDYVSRHTFESDAFDTWCNYVLTGHIHRPSKYRKVISAGSFDRLAHNEEHDKGFWIFDGTWRRVINKDATPFITVQIPDSLDVTQRILNGVLADLPETEVAHLRITLSDTTNKSHIEKFLKRCAPNVSVSFNKQKVTKQLDSDIEQGEKLPVPTEDNLPKLILGELRTDINITEEEVRYVLSVSRV